MVGNKAKENIHSAVYLYLEATLVGWQSNWCHLAILAFLAHLKVQLLAHLSRVTCYVI